MLRSASHRVLVRVSPTFLRPPSTRTSRSVWRSVGSVRCACMGTIKIASGGPGSESRGDALSSCGRVGWWGGVAGAGWGALLALRGKNVRCARRRHRPLSSGAMQDPASGTPFRFRISPATPPMEFLTSAAQLREHSIDQRPTSPTGSRNTTTFGNLDDHRFVDQIGAAGRTRSTPPHEGSCTTPHRSADGISYSKPSSTSGPGPRTQWERSPQATHSDSPLGDLPANRRG